MKLNDEEQAMLDGRRGDACRMALELLVRYGEALDVERFVDVANIAGVPASANKFVKEYFRPFYQPGRDEYDVIFSLYDLDGAAVAEVPHIAGNACHLQGGIDPENWETLGATPESLKLSEASEAYARGHGVRILKTCTPYLAGNIPQRGEHCAWMESSAVVYCNSVLGARTNTEGRESTSAAMLTGKIPDFGLHQDENRFGTHLIRVEVEVSDTMDWGMLGYYAGERVQEHVPVLTGKIGHADLLRHKHFGAAAASSGGVELYHMVGITPEAGTLETAFGPRRPDEVLRYGLTERRQTWETLNANGRSTEVDFVMLGCPHYTLEQIEEVVAMLGRRRISGNCRLWIFTSRAVRAIADGKGYTEAIRRAGGVLLTDTCSAIGQTIPPGARVAALDSAKQTHYLPAFMGIEAWFGSTRDCINAAVSGRWSAAPP